MEKLAIEAQQKRTPLPVHDGWHRTGISHGNNYLEENDFGDRFRLVNKTSGLTSPEYIYPKMPNDNDVYSKESVDAALLSLNKRVYISYIVCLNKGKVNPGNIKLPEDSPCIGCSKYPLGCKFCIAL